MLRIDLMVIATKVVLAVHAVNLSICSEAKQNTKYFSPVEHVRLFLHCRILEL